MATRLSDELLDRIRFEPRVPPESRALVRVEGAEGLNPLDTLLDFQDWPHLRYFARSLAQAAGGHYNEFGFSYDSDDHGPDDAPFAGVRVSDPWEDVLVGREAFDRLMARFYAAIVDAVTRHDDPVTREPWWREIVGAATALAERARPAPG